MSPELENLGTAHRIRFLDRPSAPALARRSDPFDTRPHPFLDHRSFELSKDSHHPEERLAGRCGRIDALLMNEEVNFLRVDLREEIDEVGEGPAEPIDRPYHHHIELSSNGSLPEGIEGRPLFPAFGAADPLVDELLDKLPAIPLGHEPKFAELIVGRSGHLWTPGRKSRLASV